MEGSVDSDLKYHFHAGRDLELIIPHGTVVHQRNKVPLPQTSSISPNRNRVKTEFKSWNKCLHVFLKPAKLSAVELERGCGGRHTFSHWL